MRLAADPDTRSGPRASAESATYSSPNPSVPTAPARSTADSEAGRAVARANAGISDSAAPTASAAPLPEPRASPSATWSSKNHIASSVRSTHGDAEQAVDALEPAVHPGLRTFLIRPIQDVPFQFGRIGIGAGFSGMYVLSVPDDPASLVTLRVITMFPRQAAELFRQRMLAASKSEPARSSERRSPWSRTRSGAGSAA